MKRTIAILALALALAACMGRPGGRGYRGPPLKPRAEPSTVLATELAFARAAREQGQWTAFREFAAKDALIFGGNGAIGAHDWLKKQADPAQSVSWSPHAVWSSCDGSLAVTRGSYAEPDGEVGRFYTVWQRQADAGYKWIFDFGYPTQAAAAAPEAITAKVAQCGAASARRAEAQPPGANLRSSNDGTLAWTFAITGAEGARTRSIKVWMAGAEAMEPVIDDADNSDGPS